MDNLDGDANTQHKKRKKKILGLEKVVKAKGIGITITTKMLNEVILPPKIIRTRIPRTEFQETLMFAGVE